MSRIALENTGAYIVKRINERGREIGLLGKEFDNFFKFAYEQSLLLESFKDEPGIHDLNIMMNTQVSYSVGMTGRSYRIDEITLGDANQVNWAFFDNDWRATLMPYVLKYA
jgi:hypothetical protein